jgi:ubiquinone/menaquinone biosynthesis C-methylase UbiE
VSLSDAWEPQAAAWATLTRSGWNPYERWLPAFLEVVPAPGRRTLDVGCGEGTVARELAALGHAVAGLDVSPSLVALAREAAPCAEFVVGDAAALPFEDGAFDLVLAVNVLMNVDDLDAAIAEAARVLEPGGRLCVSIVHPVYSAGDAYLEPRVYEERHERDGVTLVLRNAHRTLETYSRALERAGFLVEAIREPRLGGRFAQTPMFLFLRAVTA